ncbi:MAG: PepSY domain-containing protein [Gammaproteobacteria bacterium]|nr:PepSY domain-containing protein [Gammaproteobacteria bacterium]
MKTIFSSLIFVLVLLLNTNLLAAPAAISKQQAVNIATQAHPGRVLAVKRKNDSFSVKTLSKSGKVRTIFIDAKTGKIRNGKND